MGALHCNLIPNPLTFKRCQVFKQALQPALKTLGGHLQSGPRESPLGAASLWQQTQVARRAALRLSTPRKP